MAIALLAMGGGGCALTPRGTDEERGRMIEAGAAFEQPSAQRLLPELPAQPSWRDVLQRAFLANGDLEAAYFEWKAAIERIDIASGWPNTNVALGFDYMFSSERMKTFDHMTFSAGFDSMENLSWPQKTRQAGKVALAEAQAAGERFRQAKFALQERLLKAWAEYALASRRLEIARENLALLRAMQESAAGRIRAGETQQSLLRADVESQMAANEVANMEAEIAAMRAEINGMIARPLPDALPAPAIADVLRDAPADDVLLAAGVERNPELAALARQAQGRADALELARLQWLPDVIPGIAFTGSVSQAIGAMVMLPTTIAEIRGSIRESQAMLLAIEAMREQTTRDRAARLVVAMVALRNQQRQADLFERQIVPAAQRLSENIAQSYAAGGEGFEMLIETQRTLLEVKLTAAEARAAEARSLAEIEALLGVDVEILMREEAMAQAAHAGASMSSSPNVQTEHNHD